MSAPEAGQKLLDEYKQLLSEMKHHANQSAAEEKARGVSHHVLGAAANLLGVSLALFGLIS